MYVLYLAAGHELKREYWGALRAAYRRIDIARKAIQFQETAVKTKILVKWFATAQREKSMVSY